MITIKFTKNPEKSFWVGWAEYENGTYFSTGRTLDELVKHMKLNLYSAKRVSGRQIYLDTKQSTIADVPTEKMSAIFRGRYWKSAPIPEPVACPVEHPTEAPATPKPAYDYFEYKVKDGRLIVYGVKRDMITSYDLRKNQTDGDDNDRQ